MAAGICTRLGNFARFSCDLAAGAIECAGAVGVGAASLIGSTVRGVIQHTPISRENIITLIESTFALSVLTTQEMTCPGKALAIGLSTSLGFFARISANDAPRYKDAAVRASIIAIASVAIASPAVCLFTIVNGCVVYYHFIEPPVRL